MKKFEEILANCHIMWARTPQKLIELGIRVGAWVETWRRSRPHVETWGMRERMVFLHD